MTHSGYDRLLMGSPLRRSGVGKAITAALLVVLAFATLVQLVVFTGMPPGLFSPRLSIMVADQNGDLLFGANLRGSSQCPAGALAISSPKSVLLPRI
jgi:hypothetical protein